MSLRQYALKGLAALALAGSFLLGSIRDDDLENCLKNYQPDKYAVVISGLTERREVYDTSIAYKVFLEKGFKKGNIYILDEFGSKPMKDEARSEFKRDYPIYYSASRNNLKLLSDHLSKEIDPEDILFIYVCGHGSTKTYKQQDGKEINLSGMPLSKEPCINEVEVERYLDKIESENTIVLTDICYGGGFAKRFSHGNYVGISSSEANEISHGHTTDTFGLRFMQSYKDVKVSDLNKDGKVSIEESFNYAKNKHRWTRYGGARTPAEDPYKDTALLKSELDTDKIFIE